jgi:hypothetical protein
MLRRINHAGGGCEVSVVIIYIENTTLALYNLEG